VPYLDLRPMPKRKAFTAPPALNTWFSLDPDRVEQLRKLAESERTSLFVAVLSLFYGALHLESGRRDLAVGSIMANRPRPEISATVGAFANMAVLRTRLPEHPSARDVLRATRATMLDSLPHQGISFHRLAGDAGLATARAIGEVVFHMLAVPPGVATPNGVAFRGLRVASQHIPDGMGTRFDLELLVFPQPAGLEGVFRYAGDRYDREFVERLCARYTALATVATEQPDTPLDSIGLGDLASPDAMAGLSQQRKEEER
jgi:non-ribosomal peptide synthetase component F